MEKFGSREAVEALFERVREAGRGYGLEYAFEKIMLRAKTLQAHRLIHWAQQKGDAERLVERLFCAQFQRGEAVGDPAVLIAIATACGYPAEDVAAYLRSDSDEDVVRIMEARIRELGIRQVRTFIVGGREIVVG